MALFQVHEEGAKARPTHERGAGKDQIAQAERPTFERFANGAIAFDEGRQSSWWLN